MNSDFFRHCVDIIEAIEADHLQQIQNLIDHNPYLQGETVSEQDLIETNRYVLYFSDAAADHIQQRHSNAQRPGSLFNTGVDLKATAEHVLNQQPTSTGGGMVKWMGADTGTDIGLMGVAYADPESVAQMQDYIMTDGQRETVKIQQGERKPTSEVSLVAAELGPLSDGRTALSLVTMFPGGKTVDGHSIPADRKDFAAQGLYFVIS